MSASGGEDPGWQLFSSQTAPSSFTAAHAASFTAVSLGLAFYAPLLAAVLTRYRQQVASRVPARSKSRRLVFWVLVNASTNAAQMAYNLWLHSASAGASASRCSFGQKGSAALYTFTSAALYWFLVVRAEATLDEHNRAHMAVFALCKYALMLGAPCLVALALAAQQGRVLFGWACTQELHAAAAAAFVTADLSLSVLLLLLFYIPVRKHVAQLKSGDAHALRDEAERLHRAALRTLRLSVVQVATTLSVQVLGIVTQVALSDTNAPELTHWRFLRYTLYAVDLVVNTACMLVMSNVWVPNGWARLGALTNSLRGEEDASQAHGAVVAPAKAGSSAAASSVKLTQ